MVVIANVIRKSDQINQIKGAKYDIFYFAGDKGCGLAWTVRWPPSGRPTGREGNEGQGCSEHAEWRQLHHITSPN